jgi:Uma2 family endonuclease
MSFIRRERLSATMDWNDYFRITPHIAFEVRSPSERRAQIERKVRIYLDNGVLLVIFADFDKRQLTLYATNQPPRVLTENDVLTFEDIVPGFSLPVAELFALPAWLQSPTSGQRT